MATFCYLSTCFLVSRKLSLTHHHQLLHPTRDPQHFHIRASATKKPRKSRKIKSDAELCNDIREFVATVGLPEDHIPSTKELSQHGRNDLANIVRRRGYKLIRELLTNSSNAKSEAFSGEKSLDEILADDCNDLLTGGNVKVDSMVGDPTTSIGLSVGNDSSSLDTDSTPNLDDCTWISIESPGNLPLEESDQSELKDHAEGVNNMAQENYFLTEASIVDDGSSNSRKGPELNFDNRSCISVETSGELSFEKKSAENLEFEDNTAGKMVEDITLSSMVPFMEDHSHTSFPDYNIETEDNEFKPSKSSSDLSLKQKDWSKLEDPDHSNGDTAEDVPSTIDVSVMEDFCGDKKFDAVVHSADSSCIDVDSSANLSLEEKVAKFIQSGDLDPVEDNFSSVSNGIDYEVSKVHIESEYVEEKPLWAHNVENSELQPRDNTAISAMSRSGNSLTSKQVVPSATLDLLFRDDHMPTGDLTARFDKDLDAEDMRRKNQTEIDRLKFALYQKELELSRLKEQIEKEKLALSILQTKAETEISKAQKLISEKDAELHDAEESLSGLKEIQIEFCSDGSTVEVAGSFNGWHHRIRMDPQPSNITVDATVSRKSRNWSTVLWLYPGVYEIKFIVDGHWRVDPQRESVTRGHICNNILRVDR